MPIDHEIIERYGLEPPSPLEAEWAPKIDPADYSIYRTKLELIAEEGKDVLVRMGISDVVQSGDCIVGIYTAQGDLAVASVGTHLHVVTGQICIKYILKHFLNDPTVGVNDGDIFFANEALYGGIHNPDQVNLIPIFHAGELIAWVGAATHEPETGGSDPGGYTPAARSRYEEGIKFPPTKVGERFQMRTDVFEAILNHVRNERMIGNDMRSRSAACMKVRTRVLELIDHKGVGFFIGLLRRITDSVAQGARNKLRLLNDGTFRHVLFFDTRGNDEALGRLGISLTKQGDEIIVDLSGTSPQTLSYLNAPLHVVRAHLVSALAQYLFSDMPPSSGILEPFKFRAPKGTCVNPSDDAAISGGTRMAPMVTTGIHIALMKMIYDSPFRHFVSLPLGAAARNLTHGGLNQFGQAVSGQIPASSNANGRGGSVHGDGVDSAGFWWSGKGDCLDLEHIELQYPMLYLFRNIPKDQGGCGRFRGGAGAASAIVLHGNPGGYAMIYNPVTTRFPIDQGLFGGYAGGVVPSISIRKTGLAQMAKDPSAPIPSRIDERLEPHAVQGECRLGATLERGPFDQGNIVAVVACSGGGYGDPLEREPEAVIRDLRRGLVSEQVVRKVYHVAIDTTGGVDVAETDRLRASERVNRKARGRRYSEFMLEWSRLKPAPEILKEYGPWPFAVEST